MDKAQRRKLAEISLIHGIPIITNAKENSRLAGLQRKLQKLAMVDLITLPNIGEEEATFIDDRIEKWLKEIGWWRNPIHVGSLISFCLGFLENSPFKYNPRIEETLNKIAEHLEQNNELKYQDIQTGTEIINTWQKVYE